MLKIEIGTSVTIKRLGRQVTGTVRRVLNRPNMDGSVDSWNFWDLEYDITAVDVHHQKMGTCGRWKQNVDGGEVSLSG